MSSTKSPGASVTNKIILTVIFFFAVVASLGGGVVEGACTDVQRDQCTASFVKILQDFLTNPPTTDAAFRQYCSAESEVYSCLTKYGCDVSLTLPDHDKSVKVCNDGFPGGSSGVSPIYKTSSVILTILLSISALLM